jgi:prepilin-type N-terminal cleavage/methylation domain-containing protein
MNHRGLSQECAKAQCRGPAGLVAEPSALKTNRRPFNIMTILRAFSSAGRYQFDTSVQVTTARHVPCVISHRTMVSEATPRRAPHQLASGGPVIEVIGPVNTWPSPLPPRAQVPAWRVRGYSVIELMVTVTVVAILMGIAVPLWKASSLNIVTARRMVVANLRLARANAITKSIHYQVSFATDPGSVKLSRMLPPTPPATTWTVDTTKVQTSALPKSTQTSTPSVVVEFNTRGMVANSSTMTLITLTDSFGHTKSLQVWPSGQVHEL